MASWWGMIQPGGMEMTDFLNEAQFMQQTLIAHRRFLHSHAETGFELHETNAYVQSKLEEMGYQPKKCGKSGLVCTVGKGEKAFLLRADMDALPLYEQTNEAFAAKNGCMHACGHDMHTAMLLGAAQILKNHEKELRGCVKLMFQPAEELLEGARDMIEDGVLENPGVEAGMMLHVMTGVPMQTGTAVIAPTGVSAPGVRFFEIHIQGRGGHGASPHLCINPVTAAAHVIVALQTLAHEIEAGGGAVLTVGSVHAGDAGNVIADSALLRGSLRAYSEEELSQLQTRLREVSDLTARALRTKAEIVFTGGAPTLINDKKLTALAKHLLQNALGEQHVQIADKMQSGSRSSGSEDFAYVSHRIPTVMAAMAAGDRREGYEQSLHHPHTRFDERALAFGAAAYAGMAMGYWQEKGE